MKPDLKHINFMKPKNVMSATKFQEYLVYEAHSIGDDNFVPYIEYRAYSKVISALKAILDKDTTDLSVVKKFVEKTINDLE